MSKKNSYKKTNNHIYPHIKQNHPEESRKLYEEHKQEFDSWSDEERKRRGFGNHCHPRRFFIFLDRYFDLVNHYMTDEEREKHVLPWVCATRSERMNAIKKHIAYFEIKQKDLILAKLRKENVRLRRECLKNGCDYQSILEIADFNFPR
jgi:hypothetical protein